MPVHVEFFGTVEDVVREKRSLAEHVVPEGVVILNADDVRMRTMKDDFRRVVMYGYEDFEETDIRVLADSVLYEDGKPVGIHVEILCDTEPVSTDIRGAIGRPRVYAALGALAVAKVVGISAVEAGAGLSRWRPASRTHAHTRRCKWFDIV